MKKIGITLACMAFSVISSAQNSAQSPVPGPATAAPLQAPAQTASGPELVGQVTSRIALYQQVAVPGQVCANTPVTVQPPNSGAGAMVGDNIEKQAPAQTVNQTTCTLQSAYENRLIGYQVVYDYAGKQYTVQLPQDPGPTIALQITPAGMPTAPISQVTPPMGLPPGMAQPQVIYSQPAVVYGSPYYYNPYPFSTSINLGWGFRGGYGRRWR
jgi:uncharacterized protein YcfJ